MEMRAAIFENIFSKNPLDLHRLRNEAFNGCPECGSHRAVTWRLLLGYLDPRPAEWPAHLAKMRSLYDQYVEEVILQPDEERQGASVEGSGGDHPLNLNPNSQWAKHFEDNETLQQIDKDCRRLCPDLNFFQQASRWPRRRQASLRHRVETGLLEAQTFGRSQFGVNTLLARPARRRNSDMFRLPEGQEAHWEVCERLLFLYTKLNPGQGYVQGMNEVLGPIYYVLASDPNPDWAAHAEPDAFFCFTSLMSEIRDHFIKELDSSQSGIQGRMRQFQARLRLLDLPLHSRLTQLGLKSEFYAFRYLTLLLSQEFRLPDLLRVWDSLLADPQRFNFLLDVCCAMLVLIRDQLLAADFSDCMRLVQNYPYADVRQILAKAHEFYTRRPHNAASASGAPSSAPGRPAGALGSFDSQDGAVDAEDSTASEAGI
ncbi:hypothetical protein BOX15_Mlig023491g1 [Macrostomum lignano]|uniref:Rab-GAP TBC domain-containing protein n=2 Tax=Macrostomum lignano TaxID=282301 RepID=A0A267GTM5_9PLAT|nr:hypothetical protein BOX15_Mlig023491g1 [Macrostomum lignano]